MEQDSDSSVAFFPSSITTGQRDASPAETQQTSKPQTAPKLDVQQLTRAAVRHNEPPTIQKLDDQTINKIAAGEVVVAPSAALKELIENSIDAGSTQINIMCQQGGMALLQIQDDGHGIRKEDFPVLCERFTTSKIEKFNDLRKVASFGFRGEALASISYVSRLTVISKTEQEDLGFTAFFLDGVMQDQPQACAAQKGTTLQVRDLFYNSKQRRKSLGSNEEYQKVVDVVARYSVHYPLIKFTCKKVEDKRTDVSTHAVPRPACLVSGDYAEDEEELSEDKIIDELNKVRRDILQRHYGMQNVGKEAFTVFKFWDVLKMGANLFLTKPNTVTAKRNLFLLFVNNRLVESEKIKRIVDSTYALYQPKGNFSYLVYMALSVRPELIDVNVHPTKKQVIIERMDDLCELLGELLDFHLTQCTSNRQMTVGDKIGKLVPLTQQSGCYSEDSMLSQQTVKPTAGAGNSYTATLFDKAREGTSATDRNPDTFQQQQLEGLTTPTPENESMQYAHKRERSDKAKQTQRAMGLVRTDSQALTLDRFLNQGAKRSQLSKTKDQGSITQVCPVQLMSVKQLIHAFESDRDDQLQKIFKKHSYVGFLQPDQILIQFETKLVLCQTFLLLQEHLYQSILRRFQQMPKIKLDEPIAVSELLELALEHPDACYDPERHLPKSELVKIYTEKLVAKKNLYEDYFSLCFGSTAVNEQNDGDSEMVDEENTKVVTLTALPMVVPAIRPFAQELPMFLLRLATEVDNQADEATFIGQIAEEISFYYARYVDLLTLQAQAIGYSSGQSRPDEERKDQQQSTSDQISEIEKTIDEFKFVLEHELLPDMKRNFTVRKRFSLFDDLTFSMITCTENLYKVFERC